MRTALVVLMLSAPAVWASPPTTKTVEAKKPPAAKVEPTKKAEAPKAPALERHVETKKADAAASTLTLAPKKKPARRVLLADWAP